MTVNDTGARSEGRELLPRGAQRAEAAARCGAGRIVTVPNPERDEPMAGRTLSIDGVRVPRFLYGTAWKEDQTQPLTELALPRGFRGIDTANQRRHCNGASVGQAISASVASGLVAREDLFYRPSSPSGSGRTTACPTTPTPHRDPGSAVLRQLARAPGCGSD
jgi:hypothetical protein